MIENMLEYNNAELLLTLRRCSKSLRAMIDKIVKFIYLGTYPSIIRGVITEYTRYGISCTRKNTNLSDSSFTFTISGVERKVLSPVNIPCSGVAGKGVVTPMWKTCDDKTYEITWIIGVMEDGTNYHLHKLLLEVKLLAKIDKLRYTGERSSTITCLGYQKDVQSMWTLGMGHGYVTFESLYHVTKKRKVLNVMEVTVTPTKIKPQYLVQPPFSDIQSGTQETNGYLNYMRILPPHLVWKCMACEDHEKVSDLLSNGGLCMDCFLCFESHE